MKKKLFGTDGIRGVAGIPPMDTETAFAVGKAIAKGIYQEGTIFPKIVIGRDTRESGDILEEAICAGIIQAKGNVCVVGVLPTPAVAYLTRTMKADMGLMISASHNPYTDNGIKLFDSNGYKLTDIAQKKLEKRIFAELTEKPEKKEIYSQPSLISDAAEQYISFLREKTGSLPLKKLKIAIDCANGAAFKIAPALFSHLGKHIETIGVEPNGKNINEKVGSENPEKLMDLVRQKNCDVGLAFDGDADRLVAVDETGNLLTGDHILYICANYLKKEGILKNEIVVCTVMSNLGFHKAMQKNGIRVAVSEVGDRSVLAEMLRTGGVLGGEDSGHLIYLDAHTTGDALIAAILLLSAMEKSGKKLSELRQEMKILPQVLLNIPIQIQKDWQKIPQIFIVVENIKEKLKGEGRILIRYSGTQSICRIMIEGSDKQKIIGYANKIADSFQKYM